MLPAKFGERLGWIAKKQIDLGWTKVPRIDLDKVAAALFVEAAFVGASSLPSDLDANLGEGALDEFTDRMGFPGRQDIIVRLRLLQNAPHSLDVIAGVPPVALRIEVA